MYLQATEKPYQYNLHVFGNLPGRTKANVAWITSDQVGNKSEHSQPIAQSRSDLSPAERYTTPIISKTTSLRTTTRTAVLTQKNIVSGTVYQILHCIYSPWRASDVPHLAANGLAFNSTQDAKVNVREFVKYTASRTRNKRFHGCRFLSVGQIVNYLETNDFRIPFIAEEIVTS